jgi:hypothetical protein
VILTWHKLILELVRHTATYTPPVAARAFAYVGITAHEALASGNPGLRSLAGQVTDLSPLPARTGGVYDEPCVIHSALQAAVGELFFNTGPTGQRAMEAMGRKMGEMASEGIDSGTVAAASPMARRLPSTSSPGRAWMAAQRSGTWAFRWSIPPEPARRTGCRRT